MKVSSTMFGQDDGAKKPMVPHELSAQFEDVLSILAKLMRTYGIGNLVLNMTTLGAVHMLNPAFKPFDDGLVPENLRLARSTLIRNCLTGMLALYGISSITIELSDDEQKEVRAYWKYLESGNTDALDQEQFKNTPLRLDKDPAVPPVQIGAENAK